MSGAPGQGLQFREVSLQWILTQRVHVGIWYILKAQRGSHIPTLRPKYLPYSYMDPLGKESCMTRSTVYLGYDQCQPEPLNASTPQSYSKPCNPSSCIFKGAMPWKPSSTPYSSNQRLQNPELVRTIRLGFRV